MKIVETIWELHTLIVTSGMHDIVGMSPNKIQTVNARAWHYTQWECMDFGLHEYTTSIAGELSWYKLKETCMPCHIAHWSSKPWHSAREMDVYMDSAESTHNSRWMGSSRSWIIERRELDSKRARRAIPNVWHVGMPLMHSELRAALLRSSAMLNDRPTNVLLWLCMLQRRNCGIDEALNRSI